MWQGFQKWDFPSFFCFPGAMTGDQPWHPWDLGCPISDPYVGYLWLVTRGFKPCTWFSVGPWRSWPWQWILSRATQTAGIGFHMRTLVRSSPVWSSLFLSVDVSKCHSNFWNPMSESLRVPGHTCFGAWMYVSTWHVLVGSTWPVRNRLVWHTLWQAMSPLCFAGAFFATRNGSMVVPRTTSKTSLNSRPDALKLPNLLNQKQIPRSVGQISMKCGLTHSSWQLKPSLPCIKLRGWTKGAANLQFLAVWDHLFLFRGGMVHSGISQVTCRDQPTFQTQRIHSWEPPGTCCILQLFMLFMLFMAFVQLFCSKLHSWHNRQNHAWTVQQFVVNPWDPWMNLESKWCPIARCVWFCRNAQYGRWQDVSLETRWSIQSDQFGDCLNHQLVHHFGIAVVQLLGFIFSSFPNPHWPIGYRTSGGEFNLLGAGPKTGYPKIQRLVKGIPGIPVYLILGNPNFTTLAV